MKLKQILLLTATLILGIGTAHAEDGSALWLRQPPTAHTPSVDIPSALRHDAVLQTAADELKAYLDMPYRKVSIKVTPSDAHSGAFSVGAQSDAFTVGTSSDAFTISRKGNKITIQSGTSAGVLYGAYHLLRLQQTGGIIVDGTAVTETPTSSLRILNHWDNLNGTVERGYAGRSIFWPSVDVENAKGTDETAKNAAYDHRVSAYGRACASIGINGTVLNNVNASPQILQTVHLHQVAHIADLIRPYGLRVYLSVNFASPKALGYLDTADPLDQNVAKWWQAKVDEIYDLIPDFGGFLVKANSEGEPGPGDFGRTHAEGANMLAHALQPHGGIVMWRAFVYAANSPDRAMQAYDEFMPLDGQFAPNVILQVKNGPIDFQPREPIHPLLLSMRHTAVMPELQITQEYLGHSIHNVFLAPMWAEVLRIMPVPTAMAGVANVGNAVNWCGSDMAQANWYAFGRLAWNSSISSEEIAHEFVLQTFTADANAADDIARIMMRSHEACVSYMMPLGLHHIFAGGHHYGPEPWCYRPGWREDWLPRYYHRADSVGLGFDRSMRGTGAVAQYPDSLARLFDDPLLCPESYLLWFHHIGWQQTLPCGETLWSRLCHKYDEGIREAEDFVRGWQRVAPYIDAERYAAVLACYSRQAADAWWWRDACLLYFQQFSQQPLPADCPAPRHQLDALMRFNLNIDNYTAPDPSVLP